MRALTLLELAGRRRDHRRGLRDLRARGARPDRALPRARALAAHAARLRGARARTSLRGQTPRALRELMILRTAQLTDSDYEWAHHRAMARRRPASPPRRSRALRALARRARCFDGPSAPRCAASRRSTRSRSRDDAFADARGGDGTAATIELVLLAAVLRGGRADDPGARSRGRARLPALSRRCSRPRGERAVSYRIGVDIGGTFTDCVVADEQGGRTRRRRRSTTPGSLQDGVLEAVARQRRAARR